MSRRGKHELALARALRANGATKADDSAAELAREYARMVDQNPYSLLQIGRQFLEVLVELGLTPKVRAGITKGVAPAASSGLDELRARRTRTA